jgi:hypothetical protein
MKVKDVSRADINAAYQTGLKRDTAAILRKAQTTYGYKPEPEQRRHFNGMSAVAEMLLGRATGRRWLSDGMVPDEPGAGDVEGQIQVRWTPLGFGSLIVYKEDTEPFYALVTGINRFELKLVGWMTEAEAKQPEYWRHTKTGPDDIEGRRYGAYFVPQTASVWRDIRDLQVKGDE